MDKETWELWNQLMRAGNSSKATHNILKLYEGGNMVSPKRTVLELDPRAIQILEEEKEFASKRKKD